MTSMAISLDDAQNAILSGTEYGAVYELLAEGERPVLAEWFVRTPGLPNLKGREAMRAAATAGSAADLGSGELCPRCGGLMVRTGTCLTCQACGESSGGCG